MLYKISSNRLVKPLAYHKSIPNTHSLSTIISQIGSDLYKNISTPNPLEILFWYNLNSFALICYIISQTIVLRRGIKIKSQNCTAKHDKIGWCMPHRIRKALEENAKSK